MGINVSETEILSVNSRNLSLLDSKVKGKVWITVILRYFGHHAAF